MFQTTLQLFLNKHNYFPEGNEIINRITPPLKTTPHDGQCYVVTERFSSSVRFYLMPVRRIIFVHTRRNIDDTLTHESNVSRRVYNY